MTQAGIEPATFRVAVQYLNHYATATPLLVGIWVLSRGRVAGV